MRNLLLILSLTFAAVNAFAQQADLENDGELDPQIENVNVQETEAEEAPAQAAAAPVTAKKKKKSETKPDETAVEGGDTYNFYFQKGDGPGSVDQGGAQKTEPKPEAAPAAQTSALNSRIDEDGFARFEGHLGMTYTAVNAGKGFSLGGQFNASRTLGLQVHAFTLSMSGGDTENSFSARGSRDVSSDTTATGASIAATYTLVTLNEGKTPVRLSLLGGVMFMRTTTEVTVDEFSARGSNETTYSESESKTLPFVGVTATARVAKNFGVVGYGKIASDTDYTQIGISAAWLF